MTQEKIVIGVYQTTIDAQNAVQVLLSEYPSKCISILMPSADIKQSPTWPCYHPSGTIICGTLALLSNGIDLALPGIGAFIACGPLLHYLSRSHNYSHECSLTHALNEIGLSEFDSQKLRNRIEFGGTLLALNTETPEQTAKAIACLRSTGAMDLTSTLIAKHRWVPSLILNDQFETQRVHT